MTVYTGNEVLNKVQRILPDGSAQLQVTGNISVGGTRVKLKASQDLSLAPFEYISSLTGDFYFRGIMLRVTDGSGNTVDIMEDIQIIMDETDDNYDAPIISDNFVDENGSGTSAFVFFPDSNIPVFSSTGTNLKIKVSNNTLTGNVYMTLYVEVL